jgi:hypothetical protein
MKSDGNALVLYQCAHMGGGEFLQGAPDRLQRPGIHPGMKNLAGGVAPLEPVQPRHRQAERRKEAVHLGDSAATDQCDGPA